MATLRSTSVPFLLLCCSAGQAALADCPPAAAIPAALALVEPALQAVALPPPADAFTQNCSPRRPGTVACIEAVAHETCDSVTYRFPETRLRPGQTAYLRVPERLRGRTLSWITLGHRQDPNTAGNRSLREGQWDEQPGLTSVQVLGAADGQRSWRYWGGSASGEAGAKFAESSHSPEIENLYEWEREGHCGADSGSCTREALSPELIRVQSTGEDDVLLSSLMLRVQSPEGSIHRATTFSPGTSFGDPRTLDGRRFGGGQEHQGRFPGALVLNGPGSAGLPAGWSRTSSTASFPLRPGMRLSTVDVALGDSHPDGITNRDGGWGTKGWARFSIGLRRASGETIWFTRGENVPPEGVISAAPASCDFVTRPGDRIVLEASSDAVYIMGVRTGMRPVAGAAR